MRFINVCRFTVVLKQDHFINIGILRMTGEVTDRFNEIILFGMALFWQKAT